MKYLILSRTYEKNTVYEIGDEIELDENRAKELRNSIKLIEKNDIDEKKKKEKKILNNS